MSRPTPTWSAGSSAADTSAPRAYARPVPSRRACACACACASARARALRPARLCPRPHLRPCPRLCSRRARARACVRARA